MTCPPPRRIPRALFAGALVLAISTVAAAQPLTQAAVEDVLERAIGRAQQIRRNAVVSVVDREGNVLACVRMTNPAFGNIPRLSTITGGGRGGLEGLPIPTSITATSKAGTAAFLSTRGNAFTTRTAGWIIQPAFPPGIARQPSGPLFGVQLSSLPTSDFNRLPLGLAADPGGYPLYDAAGNCVGGIGVEIGGRALNVPSAYSVDRIRGHFQTTTIEEQVALAGQRTRTPPANIRADNILVAGIRLAYGTVNEGRVPALPVVDLAAQQGGGLLEVIVAPTAAPASGLVPAAFAPPAGLDGPTILGASVAPFAAAGVPVTLDGAVTAGQNLSAAEVAAALYRAHLTNSRLRAMIRRDSPQISQVNVSIVDASGEILGFFRTPDAPIFGMDVSLQKARSALFLSRPDAGAILDAAEGGVRYDKYVAAMAGVRVPLNGTTAMGERTIGFLARPKLPDNIPTGVTGPLTAFGVNIANQPQSFSVFNTGLQTDLLLTNVVAYVTTYNPNFPAAATLAQEQAALAAFGVNRLGARPLASGPLAGVPARVTVAGDFPGHSLANGLQIFPGGVPLYQNGVLVGGIGVSGDGIEQDDAVAFAGSEGLQEFGPGVRRADFVNVRVRTTDIRLPYVKFPRAPERGL